MKTKTFKQPKRSKPVVQLKDIEPKNDAKGGYTSGTGRVTGIAVDPSDPSGNTYLRAGER